MAFYAMDTACDAMLCKNRRMTRLDLGSPFGLFKGIWNFGPVLGCGRRFGPKDKRRNREDKNPIYYNKSRLLFEFFSCKKRIPILRADIGQNFGSQICAKLQSSSSVIFRNGAKTLQISDTKLDTFGTLGRNVDFNWKSKFCTCTLQLQNFGHELFHINLLRIVLECNVVNFVHVFTKTF